MRGLDFARGVGEDPLIERGVVKAAESPGDHAYSSEMVISLFRFERAKSREAGFLLRAGFVKAYENPVSGNGLEGTEYWCNASLASRTWQAYGTTAR